MNPTTEIKKTTFVGACRNFFGLKPNQTLKEFGDELKQLNDKDREDLSKMFPSVGYEIIESPFNKTAAA